MHGSINPAAEAAIELQTCLQRERFPFCFIGGLAVNRWGEPRYTHDADATVLTQFVDDERLVDCLLKHFQGRRPDVREFALRARVLLLVASNGTPLDVALGALDFEKNCIARSSGWNYAQDRAIVTCSAEDLIVHKAFASRDIVWLDVERILQRQGSGLDVVQIFEELRPLVELKEDKDIVPRLEALMRKRGVVVG